MTVLGAETPLATPLTWQDQAACRGLDPATWHPGPGETHIARRAKATCRTCPVAAECLAYANAEQITAGIWGGLTADERAPMRNPGGPQPINHGTEGGARTHQRRGEDPCALCREAVARASRERKRRAS